MAPYVPAALDTDAPAHTGSACADAAPTLRPAATRDATKTPRIMTETRMNIAFPREFPLLTSEALVKRNEVTGIGFISGKDVLLQRDARHLTIVCHIDAAAP